MLGTLTDAAIAKYATKTGEGELYTVVSQDAINKAAAKAPSGFELKSARRRLQFDGRKL